MIEGTPVLSFEIEGASDKSGGLTPSSVVV